MPADVENVTSVFRKDYLEFIRILFLFDQQSSEKRCKTNSLVNEY